MVTLSLSPLAHPLSLSLSLSLHNNKHFLSLKAHQPSYHHHHNHCSIRLSNLTSQQQHHHQKCHPFSSTFLGSNPLRVAVGGGRLMKQKKRESGTVCLSSPLSAREIQWVSTLATAVLMLAKGTAIQKSFLVPFFVLQAPTGIISWITGEYGMWSAFLALLVRLFFFIPGELELPFMALLLVIVAPSQVMNNLRGRQEGVILSLAIAAYLAFQHFRGTGGLRKAFDQGSVIATVALICCVLFPCFLLII